MTREVTIKIWRGKDHHWVIVYEGSREDMPAEYKEAAALLDASDAGEVDGIGFRYRRLTGLVFMRNPLETVYCLDAGYY